MALPLILLALTIFSIKVNAVDRIQNLENKIEKVLLESQADTIKEKASGEKKAVILEKMNGDKGKEVKKIIIIDGKATISDLKPEDIESIRLIKKDGLKLERDAKNSKGEVKELRIEGQIFLEDSDKDQNIMILTTRSKNGEASKQFIMDPSDKIDNRKLFIVDQNSKGEIENAVKRIKGKVATDITVTGFQEILADTVVVHRKPNLNNKIMDDQVVYMLDGKKVDSSIFKNIKPEEIQSMNVLKGESAQKKYKDLQGKDVIEIILKKK
jgi:hypothetical protein